jgi:hypothetical protein
MVACVSLVRYQVGFNSKETAIFIYIEVVDKETQCLYICSFCGRNVYLVSFYMKKKLVAS